VYQPQHVGITFIYINTSALRLNKLFWTMALSARPKTNNYLSISALVSWVWIQLLDCSHCYSLYKGGY